MDIEEYQIEQRTSKRSCELVARECGGWLALGRLTGGLRFAAEGTSEADAQEAFETLARRWERVLSEIKSER